MRVTPQPRNKPKVYILIEWNMCVGFYLPWSYKWWRIFDKLMVIGYIISGLGSVQYIDWFYAVTTASTSRTGIAMHSVLQPRKTCIRTLSHILQFKPNLYTLLTMIAKMAKTARNQNEQCILFVVCLIYTKKKNTSWWSSPKRCVWICSIWF